MIPVTDMSVRRLDVLFWRVGIAEAFCFCAVVIGLIAHLLYLRQPFFMDEVPILLNHKAFISNFSVVPEHAKYPTFFSYVSFPGTALAGLSEYLGSAASDFQTALGTLFFLDPDRAVLPARVISLGCLIAACITLYSMTRTFGRQIALISCLLLFVTPGLLEYGSYALPEMLVVLLSALCLKFLFKSLDSADVALARRWILAAAFVAGLAVSTKYNAVALLPAVGASLIAVWRSSSRVGIGAFISLAVISGIIALIAFLIGSPGWILRFDLFLDETIFEVVHAGRGHLGNSGTPYLGQAELLITQFPVLSVAALLGFGIWSITSGDRHGCIATVLIVATILLCAQSQKQSAQYLFPMLPALVFFTARLWKGLVDRLGHSTHLVASFVLLALSSASLTMGLAYAKPNTTRLTETWLAGNVSADQSIAMDWAYGPRFLSEKRFAELADSLGPETVALRMAEQPTTRISTIEYSVDYLVDSDVDFIIVNEGAYGRFFEFGAFTRLPPDTGTQIADEFWQSRNFYEALFASERWQLVFSADTGNGPRTLVFARSHTD